MQVLYVVLTFVNNKKRKISRYLKGWSHSFYSFLFHALPLSLFENMKNNCLFYKKWMPFPLLALLRWGDKKCIQMSETRLCVQRTFIKLNEHKTNYIGRSLLSLQSEALKSQKRLEFNQPPTPPSALFSETLKWFDWISPRTIQLESDT